MESQERIKSTSRKLRAACTIFILALPLVAALYWLGLNYFPHFSREALRQQLPIRVSGQLPLWILALGFLVTMLRMGVVIYGLVHLRRLFGLYEQGIIFESANVRCLRSVGKAAIAWSIAVTICNALLSMVVTLPNPPGQRAISLGVNSAQLLALFAGFMVLTIAWVMEEGRKIQAEQSLIV